MSLDFSSPIFLVGPPRSGTTLLQRLLIEEFNIIAIPESHFYSELIKDLQQESTLVKLDTVVIQNRFSVNLKPDYITGSSRKNVFKRYIQELAITYDQTESINARVVEKTPGHAFCIKSILEDFPDSKIIFLVRDPVPSVMSACSHFPASKYKVDSLKIAIKYWIDCTALFSERELPAYILRLRYEDMVSDSSLNVHRVGKWARLESRKSRPKLEAIRKSITVHSETWKSKSFDPVREPIGSSMRPSLLEWLMGIYIDIKTTENRKKLGYCRPPIQESALFVMSIIFKAFNSLASKL